MDFRLWRVDLKVREAFANMMRHAHYMSEQNYHKSNRALAEIEEELEKDFGNLTKVDKDSYNYVRRRLNELLGEELASLLYIGASKNEQTTLKLKIWTKYQIKEVNSKLASLIQIMTNRTTKELDIIMPSYLHMQKGYPSRWGHWLLNHAWFLCNDIVRMEQMKKNCGHFPLGINYLTQINADQNLSFLARELGFGGLDTNNIHSIRNRDFISEFMFSCLLISIHLCNFAKDLSLFASPRFNFVSFRNDRSGRRLDTIRCDCSMLIGNYSGIMMIFKGIPSAYDKDVKLVNIAMYDSVDQMNECLLAAKDILLDMEPNIDRLSEAVVSCHIAEDMLAHLISKKIPFSDAKIMVQKVENLAEFRKCEVSELEAQDIINISEHFNDDFIKSLEVEKSMEKRKCGGPSLINIANQIKMMETLVSEIYKKL